MAEETLAPEPRSVRFRAMFSVQAIRHAPPAFAVEGPGVDGRISARQYGLPDRQHGAWLDLFAQIARDFATRAPKGRTEVTPPPGPDVVEPLLTTNIGTVEQGYGDPAVIRTARGWQAIVTSNDRADAFPLLSSPDMRTWRHDGFAFPAGHLPSWAIAGENLADFWAPEIHQTPAGWLLCFTARDASRELCIGLARADNPEGPFVPDPAPLLTGGVIDAHLYVEQNGQSWLFWKEDSNGIWPRLLAARLAEEPALADRLFDEEADRRTALLVAAFWGWASTRTPMEQFFAVQPLIEAVVDRYGEIRARLEGETELLQAMRTPVYAQRLDAESRALVGEPRIVLVNDLAWEGHLIEGNFVTRQDGRCYLFYSGNDFSTADYGIGVAVADRPDGPYVKMPEPLLRSTADWWGPGHPSVAPGPDGEPRLFFHAFLPGTGGYKTFRALLTARLAFDPDGARLLPRGQ